MILLELIGKGMILAHTQNQLIVAIQFKPFKTTKRVDRCNAVQAFWKRKHLPAEHSLESVVSPG